MIDTYVKHLERAMSNVDEQCEELQCFKAFCIANGSQAFANRRLVHSTYVGRKKNAQIHIDSIVSLMTAEEANTFWSMLNVLASGLFPEGLNELPASNGACANGDDGMDYDTSAKIEQIDNPEIQDLLNDMRKDKAYAEIVDAVLDMYANVQNDNMQSTMDSTMEVIQSPKGLFLLETIMKNFTSGRLDIAHLLRLLPRLRCLIAKMMENASPVLNDADDAMRDVMNDDLTTSGAAAARDARNDEISKYTKIFDGLEVVLTIAHRAQNTGKKPSPTELKRIEAFLSDISTNMSTPDMDFGQMLSSVMGILGKIRH